MGLKVIEKIIQIAKESGQIAKDGFRTNFDVEFKSTLTDLVTEYDKKCEAAIINFIKKEYPTHSILAEESGNSENNSEYRWVIDPIDGTTNFAHGLPIFSVSIGLQKNGKTIFGVVNDVMMDTIYSAELGGGAYRNDQKIKVSSTDELHKSLLVTGFPYDISNYMPQLTEQFSEFLLKSRAVRRLGSAAIDLCYVASGVFDGFWEAKLNPWDYCAGKLLVEEAGGKVTDFTQNKLSFEKTELLATNGKVHNQMSEILTK